MLHRPKTGAFGIGSAYAVPKVMSDTPIEETVFFADIVGSTRMYEELGDDRGRALLLACLEAMTLSVERCAGRVVERIGDELLCTFAVPDDAARAAASMHLEVGLAHADGRLSRAMRVRVGFEHGPVIDTGVSVFGNTVHSAARLASRAKAGQTLTTRNTLVKLGGSWRRASRLFDLAVLKGQRGEQELHELIWNDATTSTFQVCVGPRAEPRTGRRVELRYGGQTWRVDAARPRVEIGRDAAADMSVTGQSVSHVHARVLLTHGRFWVEDVSTNGTRMERDGHAPATIHHEIVPLDGSGVLRLGVPDDEAVIRYRCETP